MKNKYRNTIIWSALFAIMILGSSASAYAAVRLPDLNIPRNGGFANSRTFNVPTSGQLKVTVQAAVKGFMGSGGNSSYEVRLMRGNRTIQTRRVTTNTTFRNMYFDVNVSCSGTGRYYFRVRNVLPANRQAGIAKFRSFNPPAPSSRTSNLSRFGIVQGQTITRDIPRHLEPRVPGRMTLTATWGSTCNLDPAGCKLRFQILRNGRVIRTTRWGYTYTSPFAPPGQKLGISFDVPQNQVGGDWRLRVTASSIGNAANVIPKIKYVTGCR